MRNKMALFLLSCTVGCAGSGDANVAANGAASAAALTVTYKNPVIPQKFADPAVVAADGGYYAYATNGGGGHVQTRFSTDLQTWTKRSDALPRQPAWATRGYTWAPDVAALANKQGYVLYFTSRHQASGKQCIGVASSKRAGGPFVADDQPFICPLNEGGAIDAAAFTDVDQQRYVLWKNDGNCCGMRTHIYIQPVDATGTKLTGDATAMIVNDQAWERGVVEAPYLIRHDHVYYLFYSAAYYGDASYTTAYATSPSLMGPYTKKGQLMVSNNSQGPVIGPGGQQVFYGPNGHSYMVYHTWTPDMQSRPMSIARLKWRGMVPSVTPSYGMSISDD